MMSAYDDAVEADDPVLYLRLGGAGTELSPGGLRAAYHGSPAHSHLPNGDPASLFDGTAAQYVEVPDHRDLSVPTTGALTVEAWLRRPRRGLLLPGRRPHRRLDPLRAGHQHRAQRLDLPHRLHQALP
jgi:hypothetical protein